MVLDFVVRQGGFTLELHERFEAVTVGLFGPSGAGKTTMLDVIAGFRRPHAGEIRVGAHVLFSSATRVDLPPRHRKVGYVPQDVSVFPHMSVRRNILYGASRGRALQFDRIVDLLEVGPLLDREVTGLSGGERQRVALARALMSSPDLLLLDEPLTALDVAFRKRIIPYLERVRAELQVPMVYVSHDPIEVLGLADWVIVLDRGQVTRAGRAEAVLGGDHPIG